MGARAMADTTCRPPPCGGARGIGSSRRTSLPPLGVLDECAARRGLRATGEPVVSVAWCVSVWGPMRHGALGESAPMTCGPLGIPTDYSKVRPVGALLPPLGNGRGCPGPECRCRVEFEPPRRHLGHVPCGLWADGRDTGHCDTKESECRTVPRRKQDLGNTGHRKTGTHYIHVLTRGQRPKPHALP